MRAQDNTKRSCPTGDRATLVPEAPGAWFGV